MIGQMDMVNMNMRTALNIMDIGQMIHNMVKGMKSGQTLLNILENIQMVRKMVLEHIYGRIKRCMKENGRKITYMVMGSITL